MLCDVDCGTVKRFKNSIFKNRNTHAANVPHLAVWSNNPLGYVTATALFMHHPDGFLHRGTVIRVDGGKILLKVRRPFCGSRPKIWEFRISSGWRGYETSSFLPLVIVSERSSPSRVCFAAPFRRALDRCGPLRTAFH